MIIWVVYDISSNRIRNQVAKVCKDRGLFRVQRSTFAGDLTTREQRALLVQLRKLIKSEEDSVYLFATSKSQFDELEIVGKGFDRELISGEKITIII